MNSIVSPSEFDTSDVPRRAATTQDVVVLHDSAKEGPLAFDPTITQTFGPLDPQDLQPRGSIGDINSTARGSGARFNAGKVPLELIPLRFVALWYALAIKNPTPEQNRAMGALFRLGEFQETGINSYLYGVLSELGDGWDDCARVFDYGRKKYAEWNWAKGMPWSVPVACAARHLRHILENENMDEESGFSHVGHVYCNIVMLLQYQLTYKDGDNLPRMLSLLRAQAETPA